MTTANESQIKTVFKGGGLFTLGMLGSNVLAFASGILIIRLLSVEQYGDFALGNATVALLSVICLAGVPDAMVKMASQRDKAGGGASFKVNQIIGSSIFIVLALSLLATIIVFVLADTFSKIFSSKYLADVFRFLAFTIPFITLMSLMNAYFRFKNDAKPKVIFQDVFFNGIRGLFLVLAMYFAFSFEGILSLYIFSAGLSFLSYSIYLWCKKDNDFSIIGNAETIKMLLLVSLPILAVTVLGNLNIWLVSALTSYFHSAEVVAYFSAPTRLSIFLSLPLQALGYIYLPQASRTTDVVVRPKLSGLYESVTKWSILISLPLFVYIFFQAEFIVTFLFGVDYLPSADILRILTIGYSINTLMGHNYLTLVALGASKVMVMASVVSLLILVAVGWVLIPVTGHLGAATALTVSLVVLNCVLSWKLFYGYQISGFSKNMVKTVLLASVTCAIILFVLEQVLDGILLGLVFAVLAYVFVIFSPRLSGKLSKDDEQIYSVILNKFSRRK